MLASYADETGHAKDPNKKHLGLACLLADAEKWERFDSEWRLVCKRHGANLPFHMTDFAARRKQFSDPLWNEKGRRENFQAGLLDTIEGADVVPIGAVVNVTDFNSLEIAQRRILGGEQEEPYFVVFQSCTRELAFAAALAEVQRMHTPTDSAETISMVYAKLKKCTGKAEVLWKEMRGHTLLGNWMGCYTVGEPPDHTPLQAADLWAYELGHHFHKILPEGMKWRYPFRRLAQKAMMASQGHKFFSYFGRAELLEIVNVFGAP